MGSLFKVLVVDDYDCMGALVQRYLERSGYDEVRTVRCAIEALALARREHFDLIISDHNMPGMTGLEFLTAIRADPNMDATKFIMLTCSDDRELLRQAMALGVDEYHTKPIAQQTLDKSVTRLGGSLPRGRMTSASRGGRLSAGEIASPQFARAVSMCVRGSTSFTCGDLADPEVLWSRHRKARSSAASMPRSVRAFLPHVSGQNFPAPSAERETSDRAVAQEEAV